MEGWGLGMKQREIEGMGSEPNLYFSLFQIVLCYNILLCLIMFKYFSFWFCCDYIHHYLGVEPLSEEEIVNQFRKLTNKISKLYCFLSSTIFNIVESEIGSKISFNLKQIQLRIFNNIFYFVMNSVKEIHLIQFVICITLLIKMEPNESIDVTLACDDGGRMEAHKMSQSTCSTIEEHLSETTVNVNEEEGLLSQQKTVLSRLYRSGEKKSKAKSHINFLQKCLEANVITTGFQLHEKRFFGDRKRIEKCSKELMEIANDHFKNILEEQSDDILKSFVELKSSCTKMLRQSK